MRTLNAVHDRTVRIGQVDLISPRVVSRIILP
jgi:hypothetical protein